MSSFLTIEFIQTLIVKHCKPIHDSLILLVYNKLVKLINLSCYCCTKAAKKLLTICTKSEPKQFGYNIASKRGEIQVKFVT